MNGGVCSRNGCSCRLAPDLNRSVYMGPVKYRSGGTLRQNRCSWVNAFWIELLIYIWDTGWIRMIRLFGRSRIESPSCKCLRENRNRKNTYILNEEKTFEILWTSNVERGPGKLKFTWNTDNHREREGGWRRTERVGERWGGEGSEPHLCVNRGQKSARSLYNC